MPRTRPRTPPEPGRRAGVAGGRPGPRDPLPAEVARLRVRMDRLNARLVALLQARARLALAIGRAKARRGHRAADPARERRMLEEALAAAPAGFPRGELERLLRGVFAASRRLAVRDRAEGRVSGSSRRRRAP